MLNHITTQTGKTKIPLRSALGLNVVLITLRPAVKADSLAAARVFYLHVLNFIG
jgi:hypothetical protein